MSFGKIKLQEKKEKITKSKIKSVKKNSFARFDFPLRAVHSTFIIVMGTKRQWRTWCDSISEHPSKQCCWSQCKWNWELWNYFSIWIWQRKRTRCSSILLCKRNQPANRHKWKSRFTLSDDSLNWLISLIYSEYQKQNANVSLNYARKRSPFATGKSSTIAFKQFCCYASHNLTIMKCFYFGKCSAKLRKPE